MSTVEIKRLGKVSRLGLGFWQAGGKMWRASGGEWVERVVEEAFNNGINFLDTAEIYGWGRSEELLGKALRKLGLRDEAVVASKLGGFRVNYWLLRKGIAGINRRLGRTVDLIQHHWPPPVVVPLCTTIRGLERLVLEGHAGAYGLSNYPAKLVEKALHCIKRYEPVSDQVQYSLAYRSPENYLKPLLDKRGMILIAWSPLAKGALAGATPKHPARKGDPVFRDASRNTLLQNALRRVAEELEVPRSVVALRWIMEKGAIPIPGTTKPGRVREYSLALRIRLSEDQIRLLDTASEKYRTRWGRRYRALQYMRFIPCGMQYAVIRLMGGV